MKKIDSLNLVPFIDIMLVLLVIVLTSASFVQHSKIPIDIPKLQEQQGASTQDKQEKLIVIDKNGQYYIDEKQVSFKDLKAALAALPRHTQIVIKGDKLSGLEFFLELSVGLQDLGFKNVYVLTQKDQD